MWQEYVDNTLVKTGNVSKAAIIGRDGKVWGISEGLKLTTEEIRYHL